MSANLPILWEDKVNSPELEAYLKQFGAKTYIEAKEVNQVRDSLNEIFSLIVTNGNKKIEKYTSEASLPLVGSLNNVYFLTVSGVKYLKYWNGIAYVNASAKTILPNMVPDFHRDYYAKKTDINLSNYLGISRNIAVIEDEENSNTFTHYFYNGAELQWIVSVNQ